MATYLLALASVFLAFKVQDISLLAMFHVNSMFVLRISVPFPVALELELEQVVCGLEVLNVPWVLSVQENPDSVAQVELHPSPEFVFPSSHVSGDVLIPFPQVTVHVDSGF